MPRQLAILASAAISPESPCGTDITYNPLFEDIIAEYEKLGSLHSETPPNWESIQDHCEIILTSHSKDLRVACYLVHALFMMHGYKGLHDGIDFLESFMMLYSEGMFPDSSKPKRRAAPLEWLCNRLEAPLRSKEPAEEELPLIAPLVDGFEQLQKAADALLGELAPSVTGIVEQLERYLRVPETAPTPSGGPQTVSLSAKSQESDGFRTLDARELLDTQRQAQQYLRVLWRHHMSKGVTDWRAYQINRLAVWLPVLALPEHDASGATKLSPVHQDRVRDYRTRIESGAWAEVLPFIETSISRAPFWITGNLLAARCLKALKAQGPLETVETCTLDFVRRLPGLTELTFSDGTPFADQETHEWLARITTSSEGAAASAAPRQPEGDALETLYARVVTAYDQQPLESALALLDEGPQGETRDAFVWKLYQAQFFLKIRKVDTARRLLEQLDRVAARHDLDIWDPELSVRLLHMLLACYRSLPDKKRYKPLEEETLSRLHLLDISAVLEP